jgi:hypothetical protein
VFLFSALIYVLNSIAVSGWYVYRNYTICVGEDDAISRVDPFCGQKAQHWVYDGLMGLFVVLAAAELLPVVWQIHQQCKSIKRKSVISKEYQDFRSVFDKDETIKMSEMEDEIAIRESNQSLPAYEQLRARAATSFNKPSLEGSFSNNRKSVTSRKYGKSNVRSKLQLEEMNMKNLHSFQSSLMEGDTSYQSGNIRKQRSNTFNEDQRNNSHGSVEGIK